MVEETILQHWILTRFAFPFLLVFFIVFAVLEKTKIFGDEKKQLNALLAFVIGLLFVTFVYPTQVVSNLILFLTVALVVMFIGLLLWGFIIGDAPKISHNGVKWGAGIVLVIVILGAVIWATGFGGGLIEGLFGQSWSKTLWTNVVFIIVIAAAITVALVSGKKD